jgi:hypothetical protein
MRAGGSTVAQKLTVQQPDYAVDAASMAAAGALWGHGVVSPFGGRSVLAKALLCRQAP